MSRITEGTLIPISLVITIIGGVIWLSVIFYKTDANADAIAELKGKQSLLEDKIYLHNQDVIQRLSRIEAKLEKE